MANELGMAPASLLKNIPSRSQPWKMPVKQWIHTLYAEKFPHRFACLCPLDASVACEPAPWQPPTGLATLDEWNSPSPGDRVYALQSLDEARLEAQSQFRRAVEAVAEAWSHHPAVRAIALFGSVARPLPRKPSKLRRHRRLGLVLHECAGIDVAVWLDDLGVLAELRSILIAALAESAELPYGARRVAASHFDVHILEPGTGRYRGRLCHFAACPDSPRLGSECSVDGCGVKPFLRQFNDWEFEPGLAFDDHLLTLFDRDRGGLTEVVYPAQDEPDTGETTDADVPF